MNNNKISHINEIIQSFFKTRNWTQRIDGYNLFSYWGDLLPVKIAHNTKPVKIQNDTLFLMVKNHIWANEINIRKSEIISIINKESGQDLIKDIVITINLNKFNG